MSDVTVKNVVVGEVMTNCYICKNNKTGGAIIVDPGAQGDTIISLVDNMGCVPEAVFLTHGHFDHILAADYIRTYYGIKIYAYEVEKELLESEIMNLSVYHGCSLRLSPDITVSDGEHISAAGLQFKVIHTPGHTSGSCCYLVEDEKILFSGDTMFRHSHGRTDFVTGSYSSIIHSITGKLLTLDADTVVYPGHDESTTVAEERLMY